MIKNIFLLSIAILIINLGFAQNQPLNPQPNQTATQSRQTTVGQLQNNTGAVQMKTFAPPPAPNGPKAGPNVNGGNEGGSKVKPNPFMTTADFAVMQKPTYEGGFKTGISLGISKSNLYGTSSFGGSALLTTDLSQRAISIYKSFGNKWYYSYSFAQIAGSQSSGLSITRLWSKNNRVFGVQLGYSNVNGDSLRIGAPSAVLFAEKRFQLLPKLTMSPNLYTTFTDAYYDRDSKSWKNDFTFNALVGTTFSYKFSKRFVLNLGYRGNINTNPKFGLMNNILIGSNFKF